MDDKTTRYNESEIKATEKLYETLHNIKVASDIEKLREKIKQCDDYQMQEHLAKKIQRKKTEFI